MTNDFGTPVAEPATVPATTKLLELLAQNFTVLEDFHPAFTGSLTLMDRASRSAVTIVIVESADNSDD